MNTYRSQWLIYCQLFSKFIQLFTDSFLWLDKGSSLNKQQQVEWWTKLTCSGDLTPSLPLYCEVGLDMSPLLLLLMFEFRLLDSMLLPWELERMSWDSREKKSDGSSFSLSCSNDLSGLGSLGAVQSKHAHSMEKIVAYHTHSVTFTPTHTVH